MNTSSQILTEETIQVETYIAALAYITILILVTNVAVILNDVLAFLAINHQVWGLWKEKRRLRLRTGEDFVILLLQQGILRFCFVLLISVTNLIIEYISLVAGSYVGVLQNVLSTILICEFTLDLRRRTTTRSLPNLSALELPDLNLSSQENPVRSIQSILGCFQQSILADMGERSDLVDIEGPDQGEPDMETA
ncbi:hypothetical protein Clacol_004539 [Clathrus columnatus]|uniref:Uncharacterized protein n=1 Tax=Clathrus columnatus TaxID=1419009 RepID=A0AAV5AAV8_9AGAM|nr:hypothetical protein Clacol_004539 [Clathrus columnatus]